MNKRDTKRGKFSMLKKVAIVLSVLTALILCFIFAYTTKPKEKSEMNDTYVSDVQEESVTKDQEVQEPLGIKQSEAAKKEQEADKQTHINEQPTITAKPSQTILYADGLDFECVSSDRIQVTWSALEDGTVENYFLQRRDVKNRVGTGEWTTVANVSGDTSVEDGKLSIVDVLQDTTWKQYEYRVEIKSNTIEENTLQEENMLQEENTILTSNVLVCIDPGHFSGKNSVPGNQSYGYAEGDFTLSVALTLKSILKMEYGIDSYMTRETGTITIDGYTDKRLDSGQISLRGEFAGNKNSDLFLSIHTNANKDNANGYGTFDQPISLNKPIIIVNELANNDTDIVKLCNVIGVNLTNANFSLGISSVDTFQTIEPSGAKTWTDEYNDSLNVEGTVVKRLSDRGGDFYGVLKGANRVGIPGIIIEHAYHTVEKTRKEAMQGKLKEVWAKADAYGIAYGFGFVENIVMANNE